jgi:hypothetical protein
MVKLGMVGPIACLTFWSLQWSFWGSASWRPPGSLWKAPGFAFAKTQSGTCKAKACGRAASGLYHLLPNEPRCHASHAISFLIVGNCNSIPMRSHWNPCAISSPHPMRHDDLSAQWSPKKWGIHWLTRWCRTRRARNGKSRGVPVVLGYHEQLQAVLGLFTSWKFMGVNSMGVEVLDTTMNEMDIYVCTVFPQHENGNHNKTRPSIGSCLILWEICFPKDREILSTEPSTGLPDNLIPSI